MATTTLVPRAPGAPGRAPRLALAWLGTAVVVLAVAHLHLRHRPATVCLLRAMTDLPCPFCGGTTAAVDLGRGHLRDALGASPLALAMLAAWPFTLRRRPPRFWSSSPWLRRALVTAALVASEAWQLHRFHVFAS